jgi:hypothetical protein
MSLYILPVKIKHRIDQLRKIFLWYDGNTFRKKYALVAWLIGCKSKERRGLGVLNIDLMNKALLVK